MTVAPSVATGFAGFRAIPGIGFSGIVSPQLLLAARKIGRSFDVVHIHLARDLVTLPMSLAAQSVKVPYFVQTHGMIDRSDRLLAKLIDPLTRSTLANASAVFALTAEELEALNEVLPQPLRNATILVNGVDLEAGPTSRASSRAIDVLFCSRLHHRKRPTLFAEAALRLVNLGTNARFALAGPDEGELAEVARIAARAHGAIAIEGALEPHQARERMSLADVLVLPSVDEPFPMAVLEAMSRSVPVIITDTCGLARTVDEHQCGLVVPGDDVNALQSAMATLIGDHDLRKRMGQNARATVEQHFSIGHVADQLEHAYEASIRPLAV